MSMKPLSAGEWLLDVRVWHESREYRKREKFAGGKKAAAEHYAEIKRELRKEAEATRDRSLTSIETFGDALTYYEANKTRGPVAQYAFDALKRDLGNVPVRQIRERYKEYWRNLQRTRSKQTGEFLSPSTVNHYTVIAKAALNLCVKDELLEHNLLQHTPLLKVTPRDVSLSEIDQQRLLNVIDQEAPHLSAIVRFALVVPCRKTELVKLRREDLDLMNNAVRVRHGNAKGDNGSWKPIPPDLEDYFRNLPSDAETLFFRRDHTGKARPLGDFRHSFKRCLGIAGIKDWHFHDFRHEAATELLNAGNPEQVVCQIAGWKSGNMIRTYYHKDGLKAVKQVIFPGQKTSEKPDTSTGHLGVGNA